jgi:hypothetical protein
MPGSTPPADPAITLWAASADGFAKSPGKEKETNWLPAPSGKFSLWVRAYWPDQAILDGTWKPAVVSRLQ